MTLTREDVLKQAVDPADLDALLAAVRALEQQAAALTSQLRALRLMVEDRLEAPAGCTHPASQRTYLDGVMGSKRTFDCGLCNERVEET